MRWMETQQGEVCRFCLLSLLLTSVEVMSSISLGEGDIFIQEQQNNMLKGYFAFQQMHVLWKKKKKIWPQEIQKTCNQISWTTDI